MENFHEDTHGDNLMRLQYPTLLNCYLIVYMLLIHVNSPRTSGFFATFAKFWIFESVRNVRKKLDRADLEVSFTASDIQRVPCRAPKHRALP